MAIIRTRNNNSKNAGFNLYKWIACAFLVSSIWTSGVATAYDSGINNNLARSRDALLRQRDNLKQAADQVNEKIAALERQLDTIDGYLRDTDNALRDVETAMSRGY
ncbi:MAG TPA: hypothetical protein V6C72_01685 [Chroococcales cyanobacterium]